MGQYDLEIDDVIRHYDVTGKDCPKYFVEHEDAWTQFKEDVETYIRKNGEKVSK
jgi:N-acetylmuramoyl-L-alanine amidase CwlA